jgi:hypothetical protein
MSASDLELRGNGESSMRGDGLVIWLYGMVALDGGVE